MIDVTKKFAVISDIKLGSKTYYLAPDGDRRKDDWDPKYFESIIKVLGTLPEYKNLDKKIDEKEVYKYEKMDLRILLSASAYLDARIDVI